MLMAFSLGNVWAGSVTISPSQALNDGGVSPITIACEKGDGTSNPAISSGQLRLYQASSGKTTGNTITFSSESTITSIKFTFANNMTASNGVFSTGTYDSETTTWTGEANTVTLTVTGTTSGTRIYITEMVVTYSSGGTPTCATPTFDPEDGTKFGETLDVEIACSTDGADVYYTLDGTDPTSSSTKYTSAISLSETKTIKAIAIKEGVNNSSVASATYTKVEAVTSYDIDFETGDLDTYINWNFVNLTIDNAITAKDGTHYAKTNGTNTASITTKTKIANPGTITYFISKVGNNTNANSKWKARVSEDGTSWTIVDDENAAGAGVTQGTWNECSADLSEYTNVYVQIYYDGTSAVRTIDKVSLQMAATKYDITISDAIEHGSVKASVSKAAAGTEVTLTATPNEHCRFVKWDVKQGETPVAVSDNKFTMPAGDVTVSATFAEIKNAVTFAAPTGGTLSILNGEEAVTTGAEIVEGTPLTVTATSDAENHYIGGTIKVVKTSDESDVTASVLDGSTLTMPDYAITVSATFTPTYAINLVAEGGSIALDYDQGDAADGYAIAGTTISAEATADDAHVFASLTVSENVTEPTIVESLAEFVMPAEAVTVTATFNVKSTPTIATDVAEVAFDATDYKGELAAKTFHVNGVALVAGKLTITSNNEAFSVSPTEIDVDGALDETEITVTPRTTECGIFEGKITISGGNAEDKEVAVSLTVNKLPANLAWSAEKATVTIDADDNVFPTLTNPRKLPVVYSSLYDEVASIDENGAVTLKKAGETMIIVNFAGNDTVTALAEDALYYTLTVQQKHTVEWYINGAKKGEQTAVAGVELENIPDATSIENGAIAGKVFRGWATATIEGEVNEAQAGIVATPTVMPGEDTRYYAVYAIEEGGEEDVTTIKYSGSTTTNMTGNNDAATLGLDANEWSVVGAKGSNSNFPGLNKAGDIRLYYNAGGSNTITITAPKSVDFVRMTFNTGYENVSVAVGGNPVAAVDGAYSINATTFVLGNANSSNVQVQIKTIDVVFATPISYTKYATSGPKKLANPTFSLAAATYTEAQSVTITAGEGETIYYTLDGTEPTTESTSYTAAIALDSYGSYTIKAIAAKEDGSKSDVVTATYGINIPFETVTDLFTYIKSGKAFLGNISVTGVVSKIETEYSTDHKNITFNISDTGAESEAQFQSYRGVGEGIAEKVAVGDKVTITGEYTLYGTTHELKQGNVISNRVAAEVSSVVISGEANQTTYDAGDSFKFEGLVATANYNTGYTKVVTKEANVWAADPEQVTATGNVNVTATYGGMTSVAEVIAVTIKSYAVTFEDPENGTLVVKNGEEAIASGDAFAKGTVLTVEAIPASANYKAGVVTVTGATLEGNTITVGSTAFTVSAVFAEKAVAELVWSKAEATAVDYEGAVNALPTLTNAASLEVAYESTNTDVAEIAANGDVTIKAAGTATIKAIFAGNETYKAATVTYELTVSHVPVVKLAGTFNDWTGALLTPNEDYTEASVKVNLTADSWPLFKMIVDEEWRGLPKDGDNYYLFHRDWNTVEISGAGDDIQLKADFEGEYTFTWTYATNTLTITFPDMPESKYYIAGDFTSWETNMAKMTEDAGMYKATVTINATKAQEFKVVRVQGPYKTWYGLAGEATMTPDNCENWIIGGGDTNIGLQPNYAGKYTFYFVPEDMKLSIDMPTEQATALDNTEAGETAVKVMQNGQFFIIKNGKTFNAQGAVVK